MHSDKSILGHPLNWWESPGRLFLSDQLLVLEDGLETADVMSAIHAL